MSKRARQMALMGFMQGALSDVMRRREQTRLEEAEARKEARLAAIRAQERGEDREFTREQFAAQQAAMDARDSKNFEQQKEFFGMTSAEAAKRDERNFQQQQALAAEQRNFTAAEGARGRAHSEKIAGMRTPAERAPNIKSFVGKSGRVVNLDMNDPMGKKALAEWQRKESVRPFYGANDTEAVEPVAPTAAPRSGGGGGVPRIGDVIDGFRYKGGHPGSPSSWEQI